MSKPIKPLPFNKDRNELVELREEILKAIAKAYKMPVYLLRGPR